MSRVLLLRHAKAGWASPGMRDFDRSLDETGTREARLMGEAMARRGYAPDNILCSSASRARETLAGIGAFFPTRNAIITEHLYSTCAAGYLEALKELNGESALLIGHNPMMEDLAVALSGSGEAEPRHLLAGGFPTAGLAVLRFDGPLSSAAPEEGHIEAFLTPGTL